jgi:hypothetical protein
MSAGHQPDLNDEQESRDWPRSSRLWPTATMVAVSGKLAAVLDALRQTFRLRMIGEEQ